MYVCMPSSAYIFDSVCLSVLLRRGRLQKKMDNNNNQIELPAISIFKMPKKTRDYDVIIFQGNGYIQNNSLLSREDHSLAPHIYSAVFMRITHRGKFALLNRLEIIFLSI